MASSNKDRKKFMFYDTEKRQVDLRIKLKNEGMNQSQFFRAMITGYLKNDTNMLEFLDGYKTENQIQSSSRRSILQKENEKENKTKNIYGLTADDLQNIFDLIEEENPDL